MKSGVDEHTVGLLTEEASARARVIILGILWVPHMRWLDSGIIIIILSTGSDIGECVGTGEEDSQTVWVPSAQQLTATDWRPTGKWSDNYFYRPLRCYRTLHNWLEGGYLEANIGTLHSSTLEIRVFYYRINTRLKVVAAVEERARVCNGPTPTKSQTEMDEWETGDFVELYINWEYQAMWMVENKTYKSYLYSKKIINSRTNMFSVVTSPGRIFNQ